MYYRGKSGWDAVRLKRADEIRAIVHERGIQWLTHFTWIENLESIMEHGLASRHVLDAAGITYWYSDRHRMDGDMEALSLSISDINYDMLASKMRDAVGRRQSPHDWIILYLRPDILWNGTCRFCPTNASSRRMQTSGRMDASWHLQDMFAGVPSDCAHPADRQAEVQVYDVIGPDQIIGIQIANVSHAQRVRAQFDRLADTRRVILSGDLSWTPDQCTVIP